MTIEKSYLKKGEIRYTIKNDMGNAVFWVDRLEVAAVCCRFLSNGVLSKDHAEMAMEAFREFDAAQKTS